MEALHLPITGLILPLEIKEVLLDSVIFVNHSHDSKVCMFPFADSLLPCWGISIAVMLYHFFMFLYLENFFWPGLFFFGTFHSYIFRIYWLSLVTGPSFGSFILLFVCGMCSARIGTPVLTQARQVLYHWASPPAWFISLLTINNCSRSEQKVKKSGAQKHWWLFTGNPN